MASEDVLEWAETSVGLLFDANYSEREALFIQNTIDRLAAEVRELRKDKARLDYIITGCSGLDFATDEAAGRFFHEIAKHEDMRFGFRAGFDAAMGGEG